MKDWLEILDVKAAATHCDTDAIGDWYRDPWSWPEMKFVAEKTPETVSFHLKRGGIRSYQKLDVPKENFGLRPALVMDPVDRLTYQALVDRIAPRLLTDLRPWVHGWRTARSRGALYAENDEEWLQYVSHLKDVADWMTWGFTTDVVAFFRSIPVNRVVEDVGVRGGSTMVTGGLESMLHAWDLIDGRSGLPQRSWASAVLANAYLGPLDDLLSVRGRIPRQFVRSLFPHGSAIRWMDDIWLFGSSELALRSAQMELQDAMSGLGLNMNLGKTATHTGDELQAAVESMHHSAIDESLNLLDPDLEPLEALVERLVSEPATSSRTSIRFATTRIRTHELFDLVDEFLPVATLMPHAADHLGRLLKESEHWRDLGDWWTTYRNSRSGKVDWSVAQLGLMFPATEPPPTDEVFEAVVEEVESVGTLPMFSFAAHRLVSWAKDDARVLLREAAKKTDSALHRRVIGLALNACRVPRAELRSILGQQETTTVTLRLLEERNFRRLLVASDFR